MVMRRLYAKISGMWSGHDKPILRYLECGSVIIRLYARISGMLSSHDKIMPGYLEWCPVMRRLCQDIWNVVQS